MNRTLITIGISIVIAALFTFLAYRWLNSLKDLQQQPQQKPPASVNVLVATTDLQPRQRIRSANVRWQSLSEQRLSPNFITQRGYKIKDIIGGSVFAPIKQGQPITKQNVILTKDFDSYSLADLIQPGMRAMSVTIDSSSNLAKYIKTGDYIDILLTSPSPPAKTITILHGAYVLAVNTGGGVVSSGSSKSSGSCKNKSGKGGCGAKSQEAGHAGGGCTVTLEVTPEQAEFLTGIERSSGVLSMSLYSSNLAEPPANWHTPIIFKKVISKQAERLPLILIKGSKAKEIPW